MTDRGVYVYGIVRADHSLPAGCLGVGSPPAVLRLLRSGRLAAAVSPAPEGLRARRRDLMAHQDVLLALSISGPVLPMRFGMVANDDAFVRGRLAEDENRCLETLERLDGRLEMNLKVFPVEESLGELLREDPQVRRLREAMRRRPGYEERVRLGEAVANAFHRRAAEAATQTVRRLTGFADDTAAGPDIAGCVRNLSFLIPRSAEDEFRSVAGRCAADCGSRAELRLTGPLPCFSFVPATDAGQRAPAGSP
ncbi:GvpL/GvpF family gas vesicle protein [Streptomyces sp. ACA25]|uniref:GvpL/GvpF family gas vesicle protein n=1 Tax=Streptomyces sp. ACA25 TaxID=3022596 RepID=UPI002307500D|nr:GvpL/GvpF family gas vesicle protein [Streptomyces sp. ACA25]MDB1088204.1 GvpL/GvpF family gas vesicle protein [Streptomyces sp. ACA25]